LLAITIRIPRCLAYQAAISAGAGTLIATCSIFIVVTPYSFCYYLIDLIITLIGFDSGAVVVLLFTPVD
jgi:hypothetical protein